MNPTRTRDKTVTYKPPANWVPELDGVCGDLEVRVQYHGQRRIIDNISTWKPNADELAHLNRGGVIELSVLAPVQPPVGMWVVDPVLALGHDEHGPATP